MDLELAANLTPTNVQLQFLHVASTIQPSLLDISNSSPCCCHAISAIGSFELLPRQHDIVAGSNLGLGDSLAAGLLTGSTKSRHDECDVNSQTNVYNSYALYIK